MWSEEGHLYYKSQTDDPTVCGIYLIAKPEQTVHVYFDYLDVQCNTDGLIAVSGGPCEIKRQLKSGYPDGSSRFRDDRFQRSGLKISRARTESIWSLDSETGGGRGRGGTMEVSVE